MMGLYEFFGIDLEGAKFRFGGVINYTVLQIDNQLLVTGLIDVFIRSFRASISCNHYILIIC